MTNIHQPQNGHARTFGAWEGFSAFGAASCWCRRRLPRSDAWEVRSRTWIAWKVVRPGRQISLQKYLASKRMRRLCGCSQHSSFCMFLLWLTTPSHSCLAVVHRGLIIALGRIVGVRISAHLSVVFSRKNATLSFGHF